MDGLTAFLAYERTPDTLRLIHTEVPEGLRGRHVGEGISGSRAPRRPFRGLAHRCDMPVREGVICGGIRRRREFNDANILGSYFFLFQSSSGRSKASSAWRLSRSREIVATASRRSPRA